MIILSDRSVVSFRTPPVYFLSLPKLSFLSSFLINAERKQRGGTTWTPVTAHIKTSPAPLASPLSQWFPGFLRPYAYPPAYKHLAEISLNGVTLASPHNETILKPYYGEQSDTLFYSGEQSKYVIL